MTNSLRTCSFFEHGVMETTEDTERKLRVAIKNAIDNGVKVFYFGFIGNFVSLAFRIVGELSGFGDIKCIRCVPDNPMPSYNVFLKKSDFDGDLFIAVDGKKWYSDILFRNSEMIKVAEASIFRAEDKGYVNMYRKYAEDIGKTVFVID